MPITTKKPKRKKGDLGKLAKNIGTVAVVGGGAAFATGAAVGGGYKIVSGAGGLAYKGMEKAYQAGKTGFGATKIPGMISNYKAKKAAGKQAVKDLNKAAKKQPLRLGPGTGKGTRAMAKGIDLVDGKEVERVRYRGVQTEGQKAKQKAFQEKVSKKAKNQPIKIETPKAPKGGRKMLSNKPLPDPVGGRAGRKYKETQAKARKLYDKASPNVKPKIAKKYKAKLAEQRMKFAVKKGAKKALLKAGAKRAVAFIPGVGLPLAGAMTVYDVAKLANKKRKKK